VTVVKSLDIDSTSSRSSAHLLGIARVH